MIGYGAPTKADTHEAHGAPLGADEIKATKAFYGWPQEAQFLVPEEVLDHFRAGLAARGKKVRGDWEKRFAAYA